MDHRSDYRFYVPMFYPVMSYILFVDDTFVFCNGSRRVIKTGFHVIVDYYRCFSQKVNKSKSGMYFHSFASLLGSIVESGSGICNCSFPFTYLGAPNVKEEFMIIHLNDLIDKVRKRLLSWTDLLCQLGDFNQACLQSLQSFLTAVIE